MGEEALAVRGKTAGFLDAELEGMDSRGGWEVEVKEGAGGALYDDVAQSGAVV